MLDPARKTARRSEKGGLPNFLIVGAPRCATTSLATYLAGHPEIHIAPVKEVHYFDLRFDRGLDWYRGQFDRATGKRLVGEASPNYMYSDESLRRMYDLLPDAKLIAILRDPVARAYSAYWFRTGLRPDGLSFEETLDEELKPGYVPKFRRPGVLTASWYLPALERICRFYPRESLQVMLLEDLKRDPDGEFASLCRFLGVDDTVKPASLGRQVNRTHRIRSLRLYRTMVRTQAWRRLPFHLGSTIDRWNQADFDYPPIDPATKQRLREYFGEHNAALARWLDRDLSMWER
ncbi:MAG: sulfotransferase domain-containing protein [Actinobacteria bacterium]|nr:MAG: sulfotransferase domain-containing protein [Actinomycetota bacterium]